MRTGDNLNLILISSGSEIDLACKISHKLATDNIYSKVISMPCHEIFDLQNDNYKSEILTKNILKVSIEASETNYWKKYTGNNGLNFGINNFGKSAPYKDIYDHFKLNEQNIVNKIKEKL
jgi:transketolase